MKIKTMAFKQQLIYIRVFMCLLLQMLAKTRVATSVSWFLFILLTNNIIYDTKLIRLQNSAEFITFPLDF